MSKWERVKTYPVSSGVDGEKAGRAIAGEGEKIVQEKQIEELVAKAKEARKRAYAPYSHFPVGAAVLTRDGQVFTGCNVENVSHGGTCCAERVALFKAISEGKTDITAIAVVADGEKPVSPCGICRQVMAELMPQGTVIMANLTGDVETYTVDELLPRAFCSYSL